MILSCKGILSHDFFLSIHFLKLVRQSILSHFYFYSIYLHVLIFKYFWGFLKFFNFFEKTIDIYVRILYNNNQRGGDNMISKIKKALLSTKIADKLIDKYLSKRSITQIANSINKE